MNYSCPHSDSCGNSTFSHQQHAPQSLVHRWLVWLNQSTSQLIGVDTKKKKTGQEYEYREEGQLFYKEQASK